jgi:hypothetical protein
MSSIKKKEKERFFVDKFLSKYQLPIGELIEQEEPDFLYKTMDSNDFIGIELTEIHNQRDEGQKFSKSQHQGTVDKIVCQAEKEFLTHSNITLNANIVFVDNLSINQKRQKELAVEIASMVQDTILGQNLETHFRFSLDYPLPKELKFISGFYHPLSKTSIWYSAQGAFLPNAKPEEIIHIISQKERKINNYKKSCTQIYLVIIEGLPPYSWYDSFNEVSETTFYTKFEKVFIYRNLGENLIELKTKK